MTQYIEWEYVDNVSEEGVFIRLREPLQEELVALCDSYDAIDAMIAKLERTELDADQTSRLERLVEERTRMLDGRQAEAMNEAGS